MNYKIKKGLLCLAMAGCLVMSLVGCQKAKKDTEIILTTDFEDNEIFRIDKASCTVPEVAVYMMTARDQYEGVFGKEIWTKDLGGQTMEGQLKETILARCAQIKVINLLAESRQITLSEQEIELAKKASQEYFSSLSQEEISTMGVNAELIEKMYGEYALANKMYQEITKDVNPEISDDEARNISVKAILIKTYSLGVSGNKIEFTDRQKEDAKRRIQTVLKKARDGEDFDTLLEEYNEDDKGVYTFGKGTMPKAFEEAAFNLDTDQISDVVETEYGYHIIKCISTFDREETDVNKIEIVEQRKNEAFNKVYDEFVKGLYSNLNRKLWDSITFESGNAMNTVDFFDIYNKYFEAVQ